MKSCRHLCQQSPCVFYLYKEIPGINEPLKPRRILNRKFCGWCMEYIPGLLWAFFVLFWLWQMAKDKHRKECSAWNAERHHLLSEIDSQRALSSSLLSSPLTLLFPPLLFSPKIAKKFLWKKGFAEMLFRDV